MLKQNKRQSTVGAENKMQLLIYIKVVWLKFQQL